MPPMVRGLPPIFTDSPACWLDQKSISPGPPDMSGVFPGLSATTAVAALGPERDLDRLGHLVESPLQCSARLRVERDQLGRHLVPYVVDWSFPMDRKADCGAPSPMMPSCSSPDWIHRAPQ